MGHATTSDVQPVTKEPSFQNGFLQNGISFSHSSKFSQASHSLLQRMFSVRVMLFISFSLPILIMGLTSYLTTSISVGRTTNNLSSQISQNIVERVTEKVANTFSYTWNFTEMMSRELPENLTGISSLSDASGRMLWKMWLDSNDNFATVYMGDPDGSNVAFYSDSDYTYPDIFKVYCDASKNISVIGPADNSGNINISDPSLYVPLEGLSIVYLDWWDQVVTAKKQFWSRPYYDDYMGGSTWFTAVYPVVDPVTQGLLSVLAIDLSSARLRQYMAEIYISDNSQVWLIVPETGILVASSDKTERTYTEPQTTLTFAQDSNLDIVRETTKRVLNGTVNKKRPFEFIFKYSGEKILASGMPIRDHNTELMLIVAYPESDFLGEAKKIQRTIVIVSVVTFICSSLIGVPLVNQTVIVLFEYLEIGIMIMITTPLSKLGKNMDEISRGSFDLARSDSVSTHLFELKTLEHDFYRMANALRSFGRFVPVDIVRYLLRNNTEAVAQVAQKEVTVMFSDIKGFTHKVEAMSPQQLSLLLSDYLNSMCAVIGENEGTVDKFIGDAIMALWNVPTQVKNHCLLACETALQSVFCLEALNIKWAKLGLPDISCRIGIHTGKALVGNLGSKERLSFTAIGDNINLGSRLEALNKKYNTSILISGEVYQQVREHYLCRFLDVVVVQGRTTPTHLYELVARLKEATPQQLHTCRLQEQALTSFLARDFTSALNALLSLKESMPLDNSIKFLIERATYAQALAHDLPAEWNGHFVLDEK